MTGGLGWGGGYDWGGWGRGGMTGGAGGLGLVGMTGVNSRQITDSALIKDNMH